MSNDNCDYVRRHYGVPAEIGRRVIANGEPGVIMADRGHYIGVILDSDPKKRIRNYHPTWEMQYGEMAETLPLKQWEVLISGMYDWDDVKYMLGDARHYVQRVWAATRSQAKYRAYQELAECFNDDATAMLTFKVRAACPSGAARQRLAIFNDNADLARAAPAMEIAVSIPVNALKEDELLHYAALDPGAAAELARRITEQGLDPSACAEELREEIRSLESQLDDESRDADELRDNAEDACRWIRRALDPDDRELSVEQLLQKALDCLE